MWLDFEKIGNVLVVSLIGELDHHSAEEVRVKIDELESYIQDKIAW